MASKYDSPYVVHAGGTFGGGSELDCFSDDLENRRRRRAVTVDLHRVTFMRPQAIVATVIFIEEMIARKRPIFVRFPAQPGVLNYLVGIGLPQVMDELGAWKWPEDFPKAPVRGLRPMVKLTKFESGNDVERIAGEIADIFDSELSGLGTLLQPCHVVFSELADNSLTHSGAPGYVLVQRFEYDSGPVIDITVGDGGIGIRRALGKNRRLRARLVKDWAVRLAMKDGITGTSDAYRGYGLGHVGAELTAPGREYVIRSDDEIGYFKEGRTTTVKECRPSKGTLVHAVIPA